MEKIRRKGAKKFDVKWRQKITKKGEFQDNTIFSFFLKKEKDILRIKRKY